MHAHTEDGGGHQQSILFFLQVSNLDMLAGEDVYWWGADGESMEELMQGRRLSGEPLVGNYSSQDMVVSPPTFFDVERAAYRVLQIS